MDATNVLGLIAGGGRLPFLIAEGARHAGFNVVCVGLAGSVESDLRRHVDVYFQGAVARPGGWMKKLRRHGVSSTVMVGRVAKTNLFVPWRIIRYIPDWRAIRIWYWRLRHSDKRNDAVLGAIADELAAGGIILEDSTMYCKEHLADEGVMTRCRPGPSVEADVEFGWPVVKQIGDLDIGQAIAVREREIIAVEAIEGTAAMIIRAGQLCRKGNWTLLKAAKPGQDMRFDVPCVGPDTVTSLAANGGKCLVVQKGKTIIIDKPRTIALADELGIAIVGH
ncbi:MAG: UDP-2,3-diacylglucosamine diphosphatase LpxI [Phycisphaerae bacterium]|nr:UDP-2,3-diacylglucosamine diphosphatase LpxI [Phycisphaerae bacterium]